MAIRTSSATWNGDLVGGSGTLRLGSGAYEGKYTYSSRFEGAPGTNPEELIGAAHAGCFSMYLASILSADGYTVRSISTTARVHLGAGPAITLIELETAGDVAGIDLARFTAYAERAKAECPVSKALAAVPHELKASLT